MQYGASVSRELPGEINLTVGYTGSQGKDMFLRGVANTLDFNTRTRPAPLRRPGGLQDVGLRRRAGHQRQADQGLRLRHLRRAADRARRAGSAPGSPAACSISSRATRGRRRARTKRRRRQNTFDYETEYGTNPQDIPHTFNGSLVYLIPGEGLLKGGWRVGGIVNARSGVPINVIDQPAGQRDGERRDRDEHPGRQQPRHAAARPRARRRIRISKTAACAGSTRRRSRRRSRARSATCRATSCADRVLAGST